MMMVLLSPMDMNVVGLVCFFALIGFTLSEDEIRMPSTKSCRSFKKQVFWISKQRSTIIIGKSEDSVHTCQLTFGVSSSPEEEQARLKVEIEFMYIHDCGVEVQINESSSSRFAEMESNNLMMKSNCNHKTPTVLYAQPKNYVRIWWFKKDKYLEAYNFRLNISMIGDNLYIMTTMVDDLRWSLSADSLPVRGPAFSTLIITGFIMFCLVCVAGTLFFKYLSHVTSKWHERSVENAIDLALCVYNSQEPLPEEEDHVCLQPGHRGDVSTRARFRPREPEIAFVHRDGRVERFRPLGTTSSSEQLGSPVVRGETENGRPACSRVHKPFRARSQLAGSFQAEGACGMSVPQTTSPQLKTSRKKRQGQDDTSSMAGIELPPSYEEAMGMPVALSGAAASNQDSSSQELRGEMGSPVQSGESHPTHQQAASTLNTVDYMNVTIQEDRSSIDQEELTLRESRSDAPLLPRDEASSNNDRTLSNMAAKKEINE